MVTVANAPVQRKRCPLCLAILELTNIGEGGEVSKISFEDRHTPDECARATQTRIVVLEQMHHRDARDLETQSQIVDDLGQWVSVVSRILDLGEKWLVHRAKRMEDIRRLRKAAGTTDRTNEHPLWQSEEELASAISDALIATKRRSPQ